MSESFTNIEFSTTSNGGSNEYKTSVGEEVVDDINYNLPTEDFNIIGVLDNVIMGEIYNSKANKDGQIVSKGGVILSVNAEEHNENDLYQVMHVQLIGENVKGVKIGDYIVASKSAGMKIVDFDGRKSAMVREENVFMVVEPKDKK